MKIRPVVDEFFPCGRTDGQHDEANVAFRNFAKSAYKQISIYCTFFFGVVNWYYYGMNEYRQHTCAEIHTDKLSAYGKLEWKPNPHTTQT